MRQTNCEELEAEKVVEGRVFLLDGEAWLLTEPNKNLYRIEDAEFIESVRKHVREIEHLTAAAIVRRERWENRSGGGEGYLPHVVSGQYAIVMQMTVDHGRESFWAKTPVLTALADQDIAQELSR